MVHQKRASPAVSAATLEVHLNVWGEDAIQQYKYKSNEAYYTFVALDPNGKPRKVNQVIAETEEERNCIMVRIAPAAGAPDPGRKDETRRNDGIESLIRKD